MGPIARGVRQQGGRSFLPGADSSSQPACHTPFSTMADKSQQPKRRDDGVLSSIDTLRHCYSSWYSWHEPLKRSGSVICIETLVTLHRRGLSRSTVIPLYFRFLPRLPVPLPLVDVVVVTVVGVGGSCTTDVRELINARLNITALDDSADVSHFPPDGGCSGI